MKLVKRVIMASSNDKSILIICFSDLLRDPRVYRQIIFLKEEYRVIAAGWNDPLCDGIKFVRLAINTGNKNYFIKIYNRLKLLFHQFDSYYWTQKVNRHAYKKLVKLDYDIILANDLAALPLATRLATDKKAKLIYDAHEYSPREFEDNLKWRIVWQKYTQYLCKKYLKETDAMLTVCDGIAKEYHKHFAVDPIVITNAPFYQDLAPGEVATKIKIIHHGAAIPGRKLELMIELMDNLDDRFTLDLMLIDNDKKYFEFLKNKASKNDCIRFIEPVAMPQIAEVINNYDIGLFILDGVNFNWRFALPNKLFEFVQGRLMVFIGPSVEMAKYVEKYNLGIVALNFNLENMANVLNSLSFEEVYKFKQNSHKYAYELSANENKEKLMALVKAILVNKK